MKITQYSRISHHTTTGSQSSIFTIPPSEDFTSGGWSIYDLALSEIGVNEASKRSFIRIGGEVKEFLLSSYATASTIGTASATLKTYNLSNPGDIIWVEGKIKAITQDTNYFGYISDLWFGLKRESSAIKLVGLTYSNTSVGDFSSNPTINITTSGLTASLIVGGAAGYTISWSGNLIQG